ncbi:IclR family transcriptional regulator domain-containing protein [Leucothrix arctica]|uniref:IclR-ED domain-containing protein n=1 Tax=Leucothrix arctica TaxID=1481894 RepID=A0A317CC21_9GAMM|nr:IclR family transcriptional regulator C-terminal domain-containing protein [Leucothrix arctica]PWQ94883.1 hypothetical protein DKT75_14125 [Leucothrix arctica]
MDQFAVNSKQSLHLVAPDRGSALVLAQASPPGHWEFRLRVGAKLNLFQTSSGISLMAFLEDEHREELFAEAVLAGYKAPAKKTFYKQCKDVKAQGHQVVDSKQLVGMKDISVPIRSPYGEGFAVLTCPYMQRLEDSSEVDPQATLDLLLTLANELSIN